MMHSERSFSDFLIFITALNTLLYFVFIGSLEFDKKQIRKVT